MPDKQIAISLMQMEAGTAAREICCKMGSAEAIYYRWKMVHGGTGFSEIWRLKQRVDKNSNIDACTTEGLPPKINQSRKGQSAARTSQSMCQSRHDS